ncbi:MAG TPA: TetR/AcrR family transcriptional regulator [Bryobacteraceae bacterium]|nr:TetR/AcrR family transcriptional regulator [Bryobacteraceae bacterium]
MRLPAPRKYRASDKRRATEQQNRVAIEAAAWEVFCTIGMDAANIRDIVRRSGVSAGTFYNYYRTREAIFEVLSERVLERIRNESRVARARAATAEEFVSACYESYLHVLESTPGAMDFIDRNQHHIRARLYPSSAVSGLALDLAEDLQRFVAPNSLSRQDLALMASILIAAGAEGVFHLGREPRMTLSQLRDFLARFVLHGLSGWR